MEHMNDRVVFVDGASGGIAVAIIQRLIKAGATVCAVSSDPKKLENVLGQQHDRLLFLECNREDDGALKRCAELAVEKFGYLSDVCIMSGTSSRIPFTQDNVQAFRDDHEGNVVRPYQVVQACFSYLKDTAMNRDITPTIFFAGSLSGLGVRTTRSPGYAASKAGLNTLVQETAARSRDEGNQVRVVNLVMDSVDTGMSSLPTQPGQHKIEAGDIASFVLFCMGLNKGLMYLVLGMGTQYDARF